MKLVAFIAVSVLCWALLSRIKNDLYHAETICSPTVSLQRQDT